MTPPPRRPPKLLGEHPPAPAARALRIAPPGRSPLGKDQQTFNRLLSTLQARQAELAQWQALQDRHPQWVMNKLLPLQAQLLQARRDLILRCDAILEGRRGGATGKAERKQLIKVILDLCLAHLSAHGDDQPIIAIHDRHATTGHAAREADARRATSVFARETTDPEIDPDVDGEATAALVVDAAPGAEAEAEAEAERAWASREAGRRSRQGGKARVRAAAAAASKQTARDVSQTVRAVYRKLASASHPDRAVDAADRDRRHELMLRVNHANDGSDLLGLLTLQLEIEQLDAEELATLPGSRLEHYNQVLRAQAADVTLAVDRIETAFRMMLTSSPRLLTPQIVERDLKRHIAAGRRELDLLEKLANAVLDPAFRRNWLREETAQRRADERSGSSARP